MSTTSASHYKKPLEHLIAYVLLHDAGEPATRADNKQGIQRYVNKVLWIFCLWEVGVVSILKLVKILCLTALFNAHRACV
jgi:hypothetical protein